MKSKTKKRLIIWGSIVGFLVLLHITLPFILVNYVNKTLKNIDGYTGSVEWIHINLFRGSYTIHTIEILKSGEELPEPFFAAEQIDLSLEWRALLDGAISSKIILDKPVLVIIPSTEKSDSSNTGQTGTEVDWTKPIKDLMPIKINRFEILNGNIHYKDIASDPKVDVYFSELYLLVENLSNTESLEENLPSPFEISANSIGGGKLKVDGGLNIIKETPDFDFNLSFENLNMVALNDFMTAYAKADVETGNLSVYSELSAKGGEITGYVKPLIKNLKFLNFKEKDQSVLKVAWEAILEGVTEIFENQKKDQFASKIPVSGKFDNVNTKILPTLGNVFKNAFIQAFKGETDNTIDFNAQEEK